MDLASAIRRRLKELRIEQKDLAVAADVTESYVSQLLSRKKAPPAPDRTDIYSKMEELLRFPGGELARRASIQREGALKRKLGSSPRPLYGEFRELILRKCEPGRRERMRAAFESEPFGELERLITKKLLDVAQRVAKEELENEDWLRQMAHLSGGSYEQMRVAILEFLDTDVFSVSAENCVSFLEPLLESWGMDFESFGVEIVLNRRLAFEPLKRFEFVETKPGQSGETPPGLDQFLKDSALSGDVTAEEIEFLRRLRFSGKQPTPLYYYREIQSLRDPLHFAAARSGSKSAPRVRRTRVKPAAKGGGRKSSGGEWGG